jgi:hypothetical protein
VIDLNPFEAYRLFENLPPSAGYLFWHGKGERYENVASRFAAITKSLDL